MTKVCFFVLNLPNMNGIIMLSVILGPLKYILQHLGICCWIIRSHIWVFGRKDKVKRGGPKLNEGSGQEQIVRAVLGHVLDLVDEWFCWSFRRLLSPHWSEETGGTSGREPPNELLWASRCDLI